MYHLFKNEIVKSKEQKTDMPVLLFLLVVYANVLSNVQYLEGYVALYILKHGVVVLAAIFGIKLLHHIRFSVMIFFLFLSACYAFAGLYFYALMIIPFGIATNYFGFHFYRIQQSNFLLIYYISIAALFVSLSGPDYYVDGFFNTTYGRPRFTTPFGHPKEAAIIVTAPLLLAVTSYQPSKAKYTFSILASYLISSRNILLFWVISALSRSKYTLVLLLLVITSFVFYAVTFVEVETLDRYTSLRAGHWLRAVMNAASISESAQGINFTQRFGLDSFWVEAVVLFGVLPTLMLLTIFLIVVLLRKSYLMLSIGMAFLATTFFDTGIASTGNLLHLLFFTVIQARKVSVQRND